MSKELIKRILMEEDVISSINNNFSLLIDLIPEIQNMVGFEHKNPTFNLCC